MLNEVMVSPPPPPTPQLKWGDLKICQNFVGTNFFLKFVGGDKPLWGELKLYGGGNIYYYNFIISFL